MPFNINTFKQRGLVFGGARPSLFQINLTVPIGIGIDLASVDKFTFTARAADLPASEVASFDVPYFGRTIKVAGDRTFSAWSTTIMNDEDFSVRSMFELWSNAINRMQANIRDPNLAAEQYKADFEIIQFAKDGSIIRSYTMIGAWPTSVGNISLDWSSTSQIEEFTVNFAYDYWLPLVEGVNPYLTQAVTPAGEL